MFVRVRALIIKEILAVWRDKKSRTVLIIPPLLQLLIFAYAATLDVTNAPIGILNRDSGKPAYELIQRFAGSNVFHNIHYLKNEKDLERAVDNQEVVMVLHFDEQFSRNLYAQKPAAVQVILDGRKSNTAQIVQGYAAGIIDRFSQDFAKERGFPIQSSLLIVRNWFNPNLLYYWFNVINLSGVLTMLVSMVVTALSVARERELGTFDQLLVSPVMPHEILMGKAIPAIIISIIEGSVIILAAVFIFNIPLVGSVLLLYFSLFVFVCSIVGVGLFLSSLVKTQQQAILGSFLFMSPAILLSGYATPVENMPPWLEFLDKANPLRYFLVIVKGIFLKDMPLSIVFSNIWPMVIIAIFTLTGADWFFRKRLE
jgi:ABC-2 type transport system permease protein